jgi:hypothetical protein
MIARWLRWRRYVARILLPFSLSGFYEPRRGLVVSEQTILTRRRGGAERGAPARRGILSRYQAVNFAVSLWAEQGAVPEQPPPRLRASARTKLFYAEAAEFRRGAEMAVMGVMLGGGERG